jgi:Electron transfer DM13
MAATSSASRIFSLRQTATLIVRLSPLQRPTTTAQIAASPFAEVAPLAATVGSMNYSVPSGVDVATYHALVIWCQRTTTAYAAAAL